MRALGFCLASMLALAWVLSGACAHGPTVPPLPPLPGPNINDWSAHAVDGGGQ